jgi:lipoprotein-anchoring transpeptidase ErfK/SrfK
VPDRVRLLIFDLDGTLIDSQRDLANSVNAAREHLGLGPIADNLIYTYVGNGAPVLIRRALGPETPQAEVDKALEFSVGVGKSGWRWFGRAAVEGKYVKPSWQAPPELHRGTYGAVIPGGAPNNPMGVAALTLRNGEYAIHGTNNPKSVGGFVSHGCIRMYNKDITRLFAMVSVGTPVVIEK